MQLMTREHPLIAMSACPGSSLPAAPSVNLNDGGGEKGASSEEATHPKPADGGSRSHAAVSPVTQGVEAAKIPFAASSGARNCLVWNCRGVGGSRTVRELVSLNSIHHPSFVFLCETRQNKDKVRRLCSRLGLRGFAGVSSAGFSGGLALFWDDQMCIEVKELDERYIDVYVRASPNNVQWRLTCVYGEPRVENRHLMWDKLRSLKATSNLPWAVVGDFNEALWQFEHFSFTSRPEA